MQLPHLDEAGGDGAAALAAGAGAGLDGDASPLKRAALASFSARSAAICALRGRQLEVFQITKQVITAPIYKQYIMSKLRKQLFSIHHWNEIQE